MEQNTLSKIEGNIFESEYLMNLIFDILNMEDRINLSLCNKKINSFFNKRTKILKTEIQRPHLPFLEEIEIPLLNKISSKYKNIKKVETLFKKEKLKILVDLNLANNLEILEISTIISNIDPIGKLINLKQLYLKWNYSQDEVTNLSFLSNLHNLEILKLDDGKITGFESIKGLTKLKEFYMIEIIKGSNENNERKKNDDLDFELYDYNSKYEILDISPISYLCNLEKLSIFAGINSIEPIKQLINLKEFDLKGDLGNYRITDISIISNLVNLKQLSLSGSEINNIEPIKYLVNLEQLSLSGSEIKNIEPIKYLVNLEQLSLSGSEINNIEPIKYLVNLKTLYLSGSKIKNIEPIKYLINLEDKTRRIEFRE